MPKAFPAEFRRDVVAVARKPGPELSVYEVSYMFESTVTY